MQSLFGAGFAHAIASTPDKTAFACDALELSYGALHGSALRIADALAGSGFGHGDVVAVMSEAPATMATAFLATQYAGCAFAPVNVRLTEVELRRLLRRLNARALLVDDAIAAALHLTSPQLDDVAVIPADASEIDGRLALPGWAAWHAAEETDARLPATGDGDIALIVSSSGSGGQPKCVRLSRASYARQIARQAKACGVRADEVFQLVLPLFHAAGLIGVLGAAWHAGASVAALPGPFRAEEVIAHVEREGVTATHWIPTMLFRVVAHLDEAPRALSTLRAIYFGSMPIQQELLARCIHHFPGKLWNTYGSTECGLMACLPPEDVDAATPASGRIIEESGARIVDESGDEVGLGETGEIVVPYALGGIVDYADDPELTGTVVRDGLVHSGDLARREAGGTFTLVGRKDAMIITGGLKVAPTEVEACLARHPDIAEVAVIGVPDPEFGQAVCALIQVRDDAGMTLEGLRTWCATELAPYKIPRQIALLTEIPRTDTGKIAYGALRRLVDEMDHAERAVPARA